MSLRRDSVGCPCSTPVCTSTSMLSMLTALLGSRAKYSSCEAQADTIVVLSVDSSFSDHDRQLSFAPQ
eukprot:7925362-Pyramimonas_sp.AAC.1